MFGLMKRKTGNYVHSGDCMKAHDHWRIHRDTVEMYENMLRVKNTIIETQREVISKLYKREK